MKFSSSPQKNPLLRGIGYMAFNYQIDEIFGMSTGYLWQREFGKTGTKNIHYLYLALSINIDNSEEKDYPNYGAD